MQDLIFSDPPSLTITSYQAKVALLDAGLYDQVIGIINHPDTPVKLKLAWNEGLPFNRHNPLVLWIAEQVGISDQLDTLFRQGSLVVNGTL